MEVEVLVATMNRDDCGNLIKKMNISTGCTIVNQSNHETSYKIENKINQQVIVNSDRGLSRSRNYAIKHAKGKICMLADDDMKYVDNYEEIVKKSYKKYPDADVIVFQVGKEEGGLYKNYGNRSKKLGLLSIMKVSSVEITFKKHMVLEKEIAFNELFGAGSIFTSGEENIFLRECLNKKLNIRYVPCKLAELAKSESTWFNGYDEKFFISKGAMFYKAYPNMFLLMIIQFGIRKRSLYKRDMSFKQAIDYMYKGKRELQKMHDKIEGV